MLSKMPVTTHMIQPDMLLMRITRPAARAMAPTLISPWLHSHRARPQVATMSTPPMPVMVASMVVITRAVICVLRVCSSMASRA
ncbi:hypothetical protein D3C84_1163850 [compost metagenome]